MLGRKEWSTNIFCKFSKQMMYFEARYLSVNLSLVLIKDHSERLNLKNFKQGKKHCRAGYIEILLKF